MRIVSLLLLTFAAILGISFAVLNAEPVSVNYYIGTRAIPLSVLLLGVLVLGILIGLLVSFATIVKLKFKFGTVGARITC